MRFSNIASLAVPALVAASPPVHGPAQNLESFLAERGADVHAPAWPLVTTFPTPTSTTTTTTSSSTVAETASQAGEGGNVLELRQAAGNDNLGAVLTQVTQNNPVTTNWVESTNDITTTWVEVIYTQTFASVIEQRETAGAGSVGLGTITGQVGIVRSSAGATIIPAGSFITVALGAFGVLAGMGMVML